MFERLTRIDAGGIITGAKRGRGEYVGTQEMLERLYEYENSNLSPEEVQSLAQAKAEGRLVVLPCKTGDTVYVVSGCLFYHDETPYTPCEVVVFKQGKQRGVMMHLRPLCEEAAGTRYHRWFPVTSIGKTVFLTREEAEKALEVW